MKRYWRVYDGLIRWYRRRGVIDPRLFLHPDDDGRWQFWRMDENGDSESETSYRHCDGRISFCGSLEPEDTFVGDRSP